MDLLLIILLAIVAATLALGRWLYKRDLRNRTGLNAEQLEVLKDVVERMRKHRKG